MSASKMGKPASVALCLWISVCFVQQVLGQGLSPGTNNELSAPNPNGNPTFPAQNGNSYSPIAKDPYHQSQPEHQGGQTVDSYFGGAQPDASNLRSARVLPGTELHQLLNSYALQMPSSNSMAAKPTLDRTVRNTSALEGYRTNAQSHAPALYPNNPRSGVDSSPRPGMSLNEANALSRGRPALSRNTNMFQSGGAQQTSTGNGATRQNPSSANRMTNEANALARGRPPVARNTNMFQSGGAQQTNTENGAMSQNPSSANRMTNKANALARGRPPPARNMNMFQSGGAQQTNTGYGATRQNPSSSNGMTNEANALARGRPPPARNTNMFQSGGAQQTNTGYGATRQNPSSSNGMTNGFYSPSRPHTAQSAGQSIGNSQYSQPISSMYGSPFPMSGPTLFSNPLPAQMGTTLVPECGPLSQPGVCCHSPTACPEQHQIDDETNVCPWKTGSPTGVCCMPHVCRLTALLELLQS